MSFFEAELQQTVSKVPFHGIYLMMCLLNELHGQKEITHPLRQIQ